MYFFSLHQLVKVPTRVTCNTVTIIDHVLASYPEKVTRQDIINVGWSEHQLIFCTRKISRIKKDTHKHIKLGLLKQYSVDLFKKTLTSINFPNYQNFNDAYDNFIQKTMVAIDNVAPIKERRIKHNSQEWFDGKISEAIKNRDKLLKKFKRSRLHIDKELYYAARYKVHKVIFN